jgi:hypothetical protein
MVAISRAPSRPLLLPSGEPPWPAAPRKVKVAETRALVVFQVASVLESGCQSR